MKGATLSHPLPLAPSPLCHHQVSERPGELERCEATVEIRKDGSVVTFFDGRELVSDFLFKERQWPRSCIIEVRSDSIMTDRPPSPDSN